MTKPLPQGLYTPDEAAAYLTISTKTLLRHVRDGTIRYILTGRGTKKERRAFDLADLETFKDAQRRTYTLVRAAEYLKISHRDLKRYVRDGAIRYTETGTKRQRPIFEKWQLDAFKKDLHRQMVYIVGFGPYVKIGYTVELKKRLDGLQVGAPEKLIVYGTIRGGGLGTEARLHKQFAVYRLNGEWFRKEGKLAAWIEAGCPL